jgi:hypothetical protein
MENEESKGERIYPHCYCNLRGGIQVAICISTGYWQTTTSKPQAPRLGGHEPYRRDDKNGYEHDLLPPLCHSDRQGGIYLAICSVNGYWQATASKQLDPRLGKQVSYRRDDKEEYKELQMTIIHPPSSFRPTGRNLAGYWQLSQILITIFRLTPYSLGAIHIRTLLNRKQFEKSGGLSKNNFLNWIE